LALWAYEALADLALWAYEAFTDPI
jgi:hypothetical protein